MLDNRTIPILQEEKSFSLGKKEYSYNPVMAVELDPVRQLILSRTDELGTTLKALSAAMSRNHAYLQQFVHRGVPAKLKEDDRRKLARLLDVEETELGAGVGLSPAPLLSLTEIPQNARISGPVHNLPTVPVYGQAVGGRDGQFILNGNKIADILAPSSLAGVRDAYAVYVIGNSMEPRYHPGEAVFVNPRLPVRKGDYVVAQIAGDEGSPPDAYVKRFLAREARVLKLEQLHPRRVLKFSAQKIVSVHRIIMGGDG